MKTKNPYTHKELDGEHWDKMKYENIMKYSSYDIDWPSPSNGSTSGGQPQI